MTKRGAHLQQQGQHVGRKRAHVLHELQHLQRVVHWVALRRLRLQHKENRACSAEADPAVFTHC